MHAAKTETINQSIELCRRLRVYSITRTNSSISIHANQRLEVLSLFVEEFLVPYGVVS